MIVAPPSDKHDFQQWRIGIDRIKRECPAVVAWLEKSLLETVGYVECMKEAELYRETGAMRDLRAILRYIGSPPDEPDGAKPPEFFGTDGMV